MHTNCNDDFERIKKRIDEKQKNKCCYLLGPQGLAGISFVSAYGMIYSLANTQIDLSLDVDTVISLPEAGGVLFYKKFIW